MRVLRRIAGDPRFSTKVAMTDVEVRIKLQMPSLDCLFMVARLRYFARLVRNQPLPLLALLHVGSSEPELPWLSLIRTDTERIRAAGHVPGLAGLHEDPDQWLCLLRSSPKWDKILDSIFFAESCIDRHSPPLLRQRRLRGGHWVMHVQCVTRGFLQNVLSPATAEPSMDTGLASSSISMALACAPPVARNSEPDSGI